MKKFFLFAAVAGMLASCSSESLTGSDPNIEPTQEERVPILLGVSSPSVNVSRGTTRGTGTVGGVGVANTDPTNVWYGQKINAFMFTKDSVHNTTLNLTKDESEAAYYDNAVMITPGTTDNKITGQQTPTNIGEAMLSNGDIKYYPAYGNFDFFGYHGDGVTGPVDMTTDTLWTVPFTIDGSNDLMSTKADTLAWANLTDDQKAKFDDQAAYEAFADFYSAKAARKLIQPVLKFNHLLTRLAFVIKAGNDNAGGWVETTPAVPYADAAEYNAAKGTSLTDEQFAALSAEDKIKNPAVYGQDPDKAVYVKSIKVLSKTTGKMAVAWTAADPGELITWDGDGTPDSLALQERPYAYETANPTNLISKAQYDALAAGSPGKDDYTLTGDNTNYNLIALTPTCPNMTVSGVYPETPIGEALIVAPSTADYQMQVTVSQEVPTNWITPTTEVKEQTYKLNIPVPVDDPATATVNEAGFQANTSYKVVLTVYGFERIEVKTEITPWQTGADILVGQD